MHSRWYSRYSLQLAFLLLIVLSLVPRSWLLFDQGALLDGDEAVQGLMSLHVSQGQGHPLFFYGQKYGLNVLETELGALAFRLFGVGPFALRLTMFMLWTVGACFFVAAAKRRRGTRAAFVAAVLVAVTPVWIPWSLKARGGYASAYLFSGVLVWLWSGKTPDTAFGRSRRAIALGVTSSLLVLAQPTFILLPLALVTCALLARALEFRTATLAVVSALVVGLPLYFLGFVGASGDHFPSLSNSANFWQGLVDLPLLSIDSGVGAFYMRDAVHVPTSIFVGVVWFLLLLGGTITAVVRSRRDGRAVSELAFVALLVGTLLVAIPTNVPRYFLPLHAVAGYWLATELFASAPLRQGAFGEILTPGLLFVVCTTYVPHYPKLSYPGTITVEARPERRSFRALIERLNQAGVKHVFALHHLLHWQVAFETSESILARWTQVPDRIPGYPEGVDQAWASGAPTALVAHGWQRKVMEEALGAEGGFEDCGRHLLVVDPSAALLKRLAFEPTTPGLFDPEPDR